MGVSRFAVVDGINASPYWVILGTDATGRAWAISGLTEEWALKSASGLDNMGQTIDRIERPAGKRSEPWSTAAAAEIRRRLLEGERLGADDLERVIACVTGCAGIKDPAALVNAAETVVACYGVGGRDPAKALDDVGHFILELRAALGQSGPLLHPGGT